MVKPRTVAARSRVARRMDLRPRRQAKTATTRTVTRGASQSQGPRNKGASRRNETQYPVDLRMHLPLDVETAEGAIRRVVTNNATQEQRTTEIDALRQRLDELERSQAGQREKLQVLTNDRPQVESAVGTGYPRRVDRERSLSRDQQRQPRSRNRRWAPADDGPRRRVDSSSESTSSRYALPPFNDSEPNTSVVATPSDEITTGTPKNVNVVPNFSGTDREDWSVWLDRLELMGDHNGWTANQKRYIILSTLRGRAEQFVYRTLTRRVRDDYKLLVKEMNQRYKKVETPQAFRAKWNTIRQRAGENEQDLAGFISTVYQKAYPNRDPRTREEDLLSKFLDSLADSEQRLAIEFGKNPKNIEEAVGYAILYREAKRPRKNLDRQNEGILRAIREMSASADKAYDGDIREEMDGPTEPPAKKPKQDRGTTGAKCIQVSSDRGAGSKPHIPHDLTTEDLYRFSDFIKTLSEDKTRGPPTPSVKRVGQGRRPKGACFSCKQPGHHAYECTANQAMQGPKPARVRGPCYICGQLGHFARDCPMRGQMVNRFHQRGVSGNTGVTTPTTSQNPGQPTGMVRDLPGINSNSAGSPTPAAI